MCPSKYGLWFSSFLRRDRWRQNPFLRIGLNKNIVLLLPRWIVSPQAVTKRVGNTTLALFLSQPGKPSFLAMLFVPLPTSQIAESMESNLLSKSTNTKGFCKYFRSSADPSEGACGVKWPCALFWSEVPNSHLQQRLPNLFLHWWWGNMKSYNLVQLGKNTSKVFIISIYSSFQGDGN